MYIFSLFARRSVGRVGRDGVFVCSRSTVSAYGAASFYNLSHHQLLLSSRRRTCGIVCIFATKYVRTYSRVVYSSSWFLQRVYEMDFRDLRINMITR